MKIDALKLLYQAQKQEALNNWKKFLSFPSVSSDQNHKEEVRNCANWLIDYLKDMGMETELWETSGHPTIFATHCKAGEDRPTLLIYHHYDVQPEGEESEWDTPPFEPVTRQDQLFARGAQDNKGQCFYTLQALKALLKAEGHLPVNIKLCIEGEEEMGSPGLAEILIQKTEKLRADSIAIVDGNIPSKSTPAITLGTRGIVTFDVTVTGPKFDLHSGMQGGVVANPAQVMAHILSSLYEPKTGAVAIPGFYDTVSEIDINIRKNLHFDFDEQAFTKAFGTASNGGEKAFTPNERAWLRPTIEINGIHTGYGGEGFKTIIPSVAKAKVSCRLVPDQDPSSIEHLLKNHLERQAFEGVKIEVTPHPGGGAAARAHPSSSIVKAFEKSYEAVFDTPCRYILEGGSIPIVPKLAKVSGGDLILVGLGLADDHIHAPNEHFGLDRFEQGFLLMSTLFYTLAEETSHSL